jgi:phage-related tail fiber protein
MTPQDPIYSLPTNVGAAKLAYALANQLTVNISHMALGDGNGAPVNPTAAATALVREVHRAQLNQLYQHQDNPNWLVAELVLPAEVGGWTIREIGLYDVDGALIFVGNHAEQYKPIQSQGSDETKTIRMVILVSSVAAVTLKTDPSTVMATIKYVNDRTPAASAAAPGLVALATAAEVQAGTDAERAVTPAGLASRTATDARTGLVELATDAEVQAGTDTARAVTPAGLASRTATETRTGVVELATIAETQTGTDSQRAVTPLGLAARTATDTRTGLVELATDAEVQAGADTTRAITPAGLASRTATEARTGLVELATAAEATAGTDTARAVTPAGLRAFMSGQVCFHAYPSAGTALAANVNKKITYATELFDIGGCFANSRFTAPADGIYEFVAAVHFTSNGSSADNGGVELWVNGAVSRRIAESFGPRNQLSGESGPMLLTAGDYVEVYAWTDIACTTNPFGALSYFNGRRVG